MGDLLKGVLAGNAGTKLLSSTRAVITGGVIWALTPIAAVNPVAFTIGVVVAGAIYVGSEVALYVTGNKDKAE
jgi:hypothetical protein